MATRYFLFGILMLTGYLVPPLALADLQSAARSGDLRQVKQLLADGANVNAKDKERATALHGAAGAGHTAVAELLLAHGANVNAKDRGRATPLHWAARQDQSPMVELLLLDGAEANVTDKRGARLCTGQLGMAILT